MRVYAFAALLGASLLLFLPRLPPCWCLIILLLANFILFAFSWSHRKIKKITTFILIASVFFSYACTVAHLRLAWQLPRKNENKAVIIQGIVASLPVRHSLHISFLFSMQRLAQHKITAKLVTLNWYGHAPDLHVGDVWQVMVKLKRIHGLANPGGFDYQAYALQHNIIATGYVTKSKLNQRLNSHWFYHPVDRLRQYFNQEIAQNVEDHSFMPMIQALVVGNKSGISQQQWQVLQHTGTNHLMVIAGLHIGLLSGLMFLLVYFFWRLLPRLTLVVTAKQAAAVMSLVTALVYSALAGFSIPTVRATVMLAVFMLALICKRHLTLGLGLAYALFVILILFPLAPFNVGFWLSFAAVATIFYAMSGRVAAKGLWWRWGRLQFAVSIGLIPFTLLLFQNASFISPIANSLVIPIVGFFVVPLSLLATGLYHFTAHFSMILFHLAQLGLHLAWYILVWCASQPFMSWQHAAPNWWSLVLAVLGVVVLLTPKGIPARFCGGFLLLPIMFLPVGAPKTNTAKFTLLDVGQGLASVVQTAHHVLVFDTGAKYSGNFNMGDAVVLPFLREQGIKKIDMLIISHGDNDHIGGAQAVLQAMPVIHIRTSVPNRFAPGRASLCLAGQHWQWDGVNFEFLYPNMQQLGLNNNSSCVLRVQVGNEAILLTGDIERHAERYLIEHHTSPLSANIIIAPHHGSKTSSTRSFLLAVHPHWGLFPVGYLNRYHFPSHLVLKRYHAFGIKTLQSDQSGAISLIIGKNIIIKPISYRWENLRFWRQ